MNRGTPQKLLRAIQKYYCIDSNEGEKAIRAGMDRRDYLQGMGLAAVAPSTIATSESEDEVPNVDDGSLIWVMLLTAIDHDDPDEAVEILEVAIELYDASLVEGPSAEDVEQHVRATVRGEYDEDAIKRRARQAWVGR